MDYSDEALSIIDRNNSPQNVQHETESRNPQLLLNQIRAIIEKKTQRSGNSFSFCVIGIEHQIK